MRKMQGVTLIELMIALALSGILITAVTQVFLIIKQVYFAQQGLSRLQENGRMLGEVFSEAIQTAGNIGCNAFREDIPWRIFKGVNAVDLGLYPDQRIQGMSWSQLGENSLVNRSVVLRAKSNSDVLWLKTIIDSYPLDEATFGTEDYLLVRGSPDWQITDHTVIALSDCAQVDFLRLTKNELQKNKTLSEIAFATDRKTQLSKYYKKEAQVGLVASNLFYIGKAEYTNAQGNPVWSLYRSDLNGSRAQELIPGVEHLQIEYGLSYQNKYLYYPFSAIKNWQLVRRIRIHALLNSVDDGLVKPKEYSINGQTILPKDRLMRMWWQYEYPISGYG